MADDILSALRALANRWALRARDYSREAKAPEVDAETAAYNRGFAEGYYHAATELAEVIKAQPATPASARPAPQPVVPQAPPQPNPNAGGRWNASPPSKSTSELTSSPSAGAAPGRQGTQPPPARQSNAPAADAGESYAAADVNEVLIMLQYAGTTPRDLQPRTDNSFYAVFSRWENLTAPERQARIQKADLNLIILESGFTKDTRDPYIVFAFKAQK